MQGHAILDGMSKKRKTRQEKKIAALRRQLATQKKHTRQTPRLETTPPPTQKRAEISPQKTIDIRRPSLITFDKSQIKKDLAKTLILSALAISLEVVVYIILRQA